MISIASGFSCFFEVWTQKIGSSVHCTLENSWVSEDRNGVKIPWGSPNFPEISACSLSELYIDDHRWKMLEKDVMKQFEGLRLTWF